MDPRLSRTNSSSSEKPPSPCNRGDPRLRATQQNQPQQHWPHPMAQLPQTHYTIGDGLTTYQHLMPTTATTAPAIYPPYAQYSGYAAAYQPSAYGHHAATYAAYYAPAPPQHIEQYQQQQTAQVAPQPVAASQTQTYAPQGAPQGSWAPARMSEQMPVQVQAPITAYIQQQQQHPTIASTTMRPISPDITSTSKQEGVEQEKHQSQADMRRQRDDFELRATALRRELEQLKRQKRELKQQLSEGDGTDRQTANILKDNAKLQAEIQIKLKEFVSMADILSGILHDRKKSHRSSGKRHRSFERSGSDHRSSSNRDRLYRDKSIESTSSNSSQQSDVNATSNLPQHQSQLPDLTATVQYNYIHYDPEIHWCRSCDAFPRTAKDLLQHLHDDDHRQLMQTENIEIPWHKLPSQDTEFPFREGATKRRVPIKGLQFFVSAPAWYCRLCDQWIGDLHCASQHLKSVGHSQNYANFVNQNPKWEGEWLEDRKKALERVSKNLLIDDKVNSALDFAGIEKKAKTLASISSIHSSKKNHDKKSKKSKSNKIKKSTKKKDKKHQSKNLSDDSSHDSTSSTTSSSEDDSSSEEDEDNDVDKTKSIRVAMRNQVLKSNSTMMDEQILILENLVKEKKRLVQHELEIQAGLQSKPSASDNQVTTQSNNTQDDRLISQWMNIDSAGQNANVASVSSADEKNKDKYLLDSLKDRLKQKQDREQKARQLLQLQQQREMQEQEEQEKREKQEKGRREREELKEKEQRARERSGMMSSSREQVKFRQSRGSISTASAQQCRSNDASPPTLTSPSMKSNLNRSSRRSRSRSRSNSSTERRSNRDNRDRRDRVGRGSCSTSKKYPHEGSRSRRNRSRSRSKSNSKTRNTIISINKVKNDTILINEKDKKQQQTITQKKLPFIGRMPLFKNRKMTEDKAPYHHGKVVIDLGDTNINNQVTTDTYEMPRQSRFQPGNLARAFIPQPDVVHYPKLITQPAPPPILPEAPRISLPQPPPPPKIQSIIAATIKPIDIVCLPEVYEYTEAEFEQVQDVEEQLMPPLPPSGVMPPLPPPSLKLLHYPMESASEDADDLAMLGISSDDMAAQVF